MKLNGREKTEREVEVINEKGKGIKGEGELDVREHRPFFSGHL